MYLKRRKNRILSILFQSNVPSISKKINMYTDTNNPIVCTKGYNIQIKYIYIRILRIRRHRKYLHGQCL